MKLCLIAAFSLALMACAGSSPRIDPARLGELQKGQTTVAEVVRQFGRPSIISRNPDGTQLVRYLHSEGQSGTTMVPLGGTAPVDSVTFYFDTKGVLTDHKTTQADADAPAPINAAASSNKPGQDNTSEITAAGSANTAQTNANKTTQGKSRAWSFPSLIPSANKENR